MYKKFLIILIFIFVIEGCFSGFKPDLQNSTRSFAFLSIPIGSFGDTNIFRTVAGELSRRGHKTFMLLPDDWREYMNTEEAKNVEFIPILNTKQKDYISLKSNHAFIEDIILDRRGWKPWHIFKMVTRIKRAVRDILTGREIETFFNNTKVDCLIIHPIIHFIAPKYFFKLLDRFNMPYITLSPSILHHGYYSQTLTDFPPNYNPVFMFNSDEKSGGFWWRFKNILVKELAQPIVTSIAGWQYFPPNKINHLPLSAIFTGTIGLIPAVPMSPHLHLVGAVLPDSKYKQQPSQELMEWLEKQPPKSVVLISMGSIAALTKEEWLNLMGILDGSKYKFIIKVKDDIIRRCNSSNFMFMDWIPQHYVLEHPSVGLFISHCGANSGTCFFQTC